MSPHAHTHQATGAARLSVTARRVVVALVVLGSLMTLVGVVVLRPRPNVRQTLTGVTESGPQFDAVVELAEVGPCAGQESLAPADQLHCINVRVQLLGGPHEGETRQISLPDDPSTPDLERDDKVVLAYERSAPSGDEYRLLDRQRKAPLVWLALIFAIAVVSLGRLRGLAALLGLAASVFILLAFLLPAILSGRSPVMVAIVGSSCIAFVALYLAHGFNYMTTTALLGTLVSLALTAVLAQIFVGLAQLSGFASDEATLLNLESGTIDIGGLVLAGVVIGALGALDDVTVTQASAVWELRAANPAWGVGELFRSGLRIGRDHVASTVNTLLLAYAGASLPLLLFFITSNQSLASAANQEVVATEIVRTLVGSIGLVASVPVTTWLAARISTTGGPVDQ